MAQYEPQSPEDQRLFADGFNVAIELAAMRLEKANDETKAACMIEEIRKLARPNGLTREQIRAALGVDR